MVALLVRRRRDAGSSRGFAGPPAAGLLRQPSITGTKRSTTGRYRDLTPRGLGPAAMCARARCVRKPVRLPGSGEARTLLACHTRTPSRLRLGESRLEVSLLPRHHRQQCVFRDRERILPRYRAWSAPRTGARTCRGEACREGQGAEAGRCIGSIEIRAAPWASGKVPLRQGGIRDEGVRADHRRRPG